MKKKISLILTGILIILIGFMVIKNITKKENVNENIDTVKVAEVTHSAFYTPFYVAIEWC